MWTLAIRSKSLLINDLDSVAKGRDAAIRAVPQSGQQGEDGVKSPVLACSFVIPITKNRVKTRDLSTIGVTNFAKSLRRRLQIFAI
jgi:hypothetical protein